MRQSNTIETVDVPIDKREKSTKNKIFCSNMRPSHSRNYGKLARSVVNREEYASIDKIVSIV